MSVKTEDTIALESVSRGKRTRPPFEDFDLMSKYLEKNKFFDRIPDSYIRIDRSTMRCMIDLGRPSWLVAPIRVKKYIYLCDGKSRFGYLEYNPNTNEMRYAEFMTEVEPSSYGKCHWEYTWTEDSAIRGMTKMVADIENMKTESEYSTLSEYVFESVSHGKRKNRGIPLDILDMSMTEFMDAVDRYGVECRKRSAANQLRDIIIGAQKDGKINWKKDSSSTIPMLYFAFPGPVLYGIMFKDERSGYPVMIKKYNNIQPDGTMKISGNDIEVSRIDKDRNKFMERLYDLMEKIGIV